MTYTFKLARRIARLRAPLTAAFMLALVSCDDTNETLSPETNSDSPAATQIETIAAASVSYAGGIPMGLFHLPNSEFAGPYNGAMRVAGTSDLLSNLAAIKANGGKVILSLTGSQKYFLDADGHFSFTKWKGRVDRFRSVNFSSYINDGTIVGHYLIDEPYDGHNFGGQPVGGATLEAMAKYSKEIWPGMATIVRGEPYLIRWSGTYRYLDAAWAQYLWRKGDVNDYLRRNVSEAQAMGLGLVVGLNLQDGGNPNLSSMSASDVASWGSALLSSSYPCAFISWHWESDYLGTSSMRSAMNVLREKAQNRGARSCRGSEVLGSGPTSPSPSPEPSPVTSVPGALSFSLAYTPVDAPTAWNGTHYKAEPGTLVERLARSESAGVKVSVALASKAQTTNADGTFSLTKWKAQVDRFRSLSLSRYVTNRTLYLHHLVDRPSCASCWGGRAIAWETVEEMARYSKSIWPALPTVARASPVELARANFRWTYLDAGWAQYNTRRGDPTKFLTTQSLAARNEGLGLVAGLDLLDASGSNSPSMTASQIRTFGTILAQQASVCALVSLRYNSSYLAQSGIRDAIAAVNTVAKGRAAGSCVVN